jgi:hypothetical protein
MKRQDSATQVGDAFGDWLRTFLTVLTENASAWGVAQTEVTAAQAQAADYQAKAAAAKSAKHNEVDDAKENAAKDAVMHTVCGIIKRYLVCNPQINDMQRELLGIDAHDEACSAVPVLETRPEFTFKAIDLMQIQIDFHDSSGKERTIPYGCSGAVFYYTVADKPVTDYGALSESIVLTHSPATVQMVSDTRRKTLCGALVWRNEKGEQGPWSEIRSIFIP